MCRTRFIFCLSLFLDVQSAEGGDPWRRSYVCLKASWLHVYEQRDSIANSVSYDLKMCPTPPSIGSESGLYTIKLVMMGVKLKLGFASEKECNQWASALMIAGQESST
eukprot:TRINITY_DN6726_c0_g1_i3.p1 TRINITY_DN6726_c0_g1~~TRINITY_DN6726_c0_g1_i3.p1  ORF type:complete len:108 (+),score=10.04 TRINITY_DN6726_c0_g1_i3:80-403(+)